MHWLNFWITETSGSMLLRFFRILFVGSKSKLSQLTCHGKVTCNKRNISQPEQFFKNFSCPFLSFLWGHWYPCFTLLVTSALGFKARVDPSLVCFLAQRIPQIHLWCHTCQLYSGQHSSQPCFLHACSRGRMPEFDRETSHTVSRHTIHSATTTGYNQISGPTKRTCVLQFFFKKTSCQS